MENIILHENSKDKLLGQIKRLEMQLVSAHQALDTAKLASTSKQAVDTGGTTDRVDSQESAQDNFASGSIATREHSPANDTQANPGLDAMPAGSTVFVTFVNGDEKYREMMINWALHLRQLDVWHVVIAFDHQAADTCANNAIPYIRCTSARHNMPRHNAPRKPQATLQQTPRNAFGAQREWCSATHRSRLSQRGRALGMRRMPSERAERMQP
jgi:hypothetical protein